MNATDSRLLWRSAWPFAALHSIAVLSRTALDWFDPPETFYARSVASTYAAIALFLGVGLWTAWRTKCLRAGALAGLAMSGLSAVMILAGSVLMVAIWHGQQTFSVIEHSGGLAEIFELPILIAIPGVLVATLGAAVGKGAAKLS
jgi:hypothetical protein